MKNIELHKNPKLAIRLLDKVLTYLSEHGQEKPVSKDHIFQSVKLNELKATYKEAIIRKLLADKVIEMIPAIQTTHGVPDGTALYFINYDGILLLAGDGYAGKLRYAKWQRRWNTIYLVIIAAATSVTAIFTYHSGSSSDHTNYTLLNHITTQTEQQVPLLKIKAKETLLKKSH